MATQLPFLVRKFEEREAAITANVLDTFRTIARSVQRGVDCIHVCLYGFRANMFGEFSHRLHVYTCVFDRHCRRVDIEVLSPFLT